jgi:hypothetical protein
VLPSEPEAGDAQDRHEGHDEHRQASLVVGAAQVGVQRGRALPEHCRVPGGGLSDRDERRFGAVSAGRPDSGELVAAHYRLAGVDDGPADQ